MIDGQELLKADSENRLGPFICYQTQIPDNALRFVDIIYCGETWNDEAKDLENIGITVLGILHSFFNELYSSK